jgi:hypothetical protein
MNSRLNAQASRKFMTMQTITERERTNVIKLLNGNLYTNKLAKRYGHQPTEKCPLCRRAIGSGGPVLKHQAAKISAYTTWGHLIVKNTKTTVTGALHGSQPKKPFDEHLLSTRLSSIKIQDKTLTYHSPRQPFRHLGILLTMDMNYKHQLKATLEKIRNQVNHLKTSLASTKQKVCVIETCIRPAITYAMAAAPYTLPEIRCFDRLLTRATKQAYKLSTSMSTAAAHQDVRLGGLGCH